MKTTKYGKALTAAAPIVGGVAGGLIGRSGDTAIGGAMLASAGLSAARHGVTSMMAKNRNLGKQFK